MSAPFIPRKLQENGAKLRSNAAYHYKENGAWTMVTWGQYATEVRQAARAMIQLGFQPSDTTCILGFNRPEWTIFDLATMTAGGACAGIYTTNSPEEVAYIVNHAESRLLLLEDAGQWAKVEGQLDDLKTLTHVVMMRGAAEIQHEKVLTWDAFMALGDQQDDASVDERLAGLEADQLATLIYTSGTTGPPKGVMLSHDNLAWTSNQITKVLDIGPSDRVVSYLPLSHIAEQLFSIHGPVTLGFEVYFSEGLEQLKENLVEARPTVFFGVPRIWEKFYTALSEKLAMATGTKAKLVAWARGVGGRVHALKNAGESVGPILSIQYKLASRLIFSKVLSALGFDETRYFVSGAAPVSREILEFFSTIDIPVLEVYGQSEDCGPTTINRPGNTRLGSVGLPFPGVEVSLGDPTDGNEDGEILVRGRNVFQGYYKDPEATAATLVDGWLQSGDLGRFDGDGFLSITGRSKEIIITAGGKNIAPKNIEAALKNDPLVAEAIVIGDRRKFLSALICMDDEAAITFAQSKGVDSDSVRESDVARQHLQTLVDEVNARFARVEHVRKFSILPRVLTVDDGELTPTLKVKRRIVAENWSDTIEAMYQD
ncbi:MAG: AMP-binding protein [Myxococcota bacterium]|nr:AMP-binding protein [Myxococcota bacterium]MEE2780489.1 AMP-binding protein [Myxococcota bacterium]